MLAKAHQKIQARLGCASSLGVRARRAALDFTHPHTPEPGSDSAQMDLIREGINATADKIRDVVSDMQESSGPSTSAYNHRHEGPPKLETGYCEYMKFELRALFLALANAPADRWSSFDPCSQTHLDA